RQPLSLDRGDPVHPGPHRPRLRHGPAGRQRAAGVRHRGELDRAARPRHLCDPDRLWERADPEPDGPALPGRRPARPRLLIRMTRGVAFLLALFSVPAAAQPRESLGVFGSWGAFRGDGSCYAVAAPWQAPDPEGWRPSVSVAHWPARRISGQLHVRLSREK